MSRPDDGHHSFLPIGNPFKRMFPRHTYIPQDFLALLNAFEERLAVRLKRLKPKVRSDICSLTWMRSAVESLSETHTDIKLLIIDLQLPVSEWDSQWIRTYLDDSLKILDVCNAFSLELSHIDQSLLFLRFARNTLDPSKSCPAKQLQGAYQSLQDWSDEANLGSPRLTNSFSAVRDLAASLSLYDGTHQTNLGSTRPAHASSILRDLTTSLCSAKVKDFAKGKVLMRAMQGVKIQTVFTFSVFAALLFASDNLLMDLHVTEKLLWSKAFKELTEEVYAEIRSMVSRQSVSILKELQALHLHVQELQSVGMPVSCNEGLEGYVNGVEEILKCNSDVVQILVLNLGESVERFTNGLDCLTKQLRDFFQIVLTGRDALLYNLGELGVVQPNDILME